MTNITARTLIAALATAAGSTAAIAQSASHAGVSPTEVVRGSASFNPAAGELVIHASDGAIINYSRFDVLSGEAVRFIQPGESARVLNRVNSPDPSLINGSISANGVVYLVNPSGVVFGPNAVISAAGLVAAAANISDADFISGVDRFTATGGSLVNRGVISAENLVHLAGSRVENLGTIVAPEGLVTMSAGETVYLGEAGGRLMVQVDGAAPAPDADLVHSGDIDAAEVLFTTGDVYSIALGGRTTADRAVASGGDVVLEGAAIDASGPRGGGEIRLEGDLVFVDHASTLRADATETGAGGEVWILADNAAGVYGTLSARGATGPGGFVETSAGRTLRVERAPDVGSNAGTGGHWLIDPFNLEIVLDGLGSAGVTPTPEGFASSAAGAQIEVGTIVAALMSGDVTLETAGAGPEPGDITLLATLDFDGVTGSTLTLRAHNDINIERDVIDSGFGDGDALNLRLIADMDGAGGGGVNQTRDLELGQGALHATGAFYNAAPTAEIIGQSVLIDVAGPATLPGRIFLDSQLQVLAADAVTWNPGAVIAASIDSRSGTDGSGDTLFAPGALQINAPQMRFQAGVATAGAAQVNLASNAPRLQGAAFGSLPSDLEIVQSADLTSALLPALSDFGAAPATLAGMDYTLRTLGDASINLADGSGLTGADVLLDSAADLVINDLSAGALLTRSVGQTTITGDVVANGGTHRGTSANADLAGRSLVSSGSLQSPAIGLAFEQNAQLVVAGDALLVDPIAGTSGAGGNLAIAASGDIAQSPAATQTLRAADADFTAAGSIDLPNLDAAGTIFLDSNLFASVVNARAITLGGSSVGGDLSLTARTGGITDAGPATVAGAANLETLAAGDIALDTTTAAAGFTLATADGDASLAGANITLNGAAITGDFLLDSAAYRLAGDALASGFVDLIGTGLATGAGDQLISAGTDATTTASLVKQTSGDLTLEAGGLLTLGGDTAAQAGSLRLNPSGRPSVPDRATIVARPDATGSLRLAASDDVQIGAREKLTALGSLTLEAGDAVTLGDVNAFGDLTINASVLTILARDPASLLVPDGAGVELSADPDEGADLIAAGAIDINASVVISSIAAGAGDPLVATDGGPISGQGPLESREFGSSLTLDDFVAAGIVLDLAAPPAAVAPNPAGLDDGVLAEGLRDVARNPEIDPALAADLVRVGVPARAPAPAELVSSVSGRGLYDDVSEVTAGAAAIRLSGTVARNLVARYDALAGSDFQNVPEIQSTLAALYADFLDQTPTDQRDSTEALAAYLRDSGARDELARIAEIDSLLANLGLTARELRDARAVVIGRFAPLQLSGERLREAAVISTLEG